MKKFALLLALVMALSVFTACGATEPTDPSEPSQATEPAETTEPTTPSEPAEDTFPTEDIPEPNAAEAIIAAMYDNVTTELRLMTMAVDLADEFALPTYAGADSAEGIVCGAFSEPMMGSQAYSISVFQCDSAEKAAELAQTMFDNIDTRKWICVEADQKVAAVCGDVAMFFMVQTELEVPTADVVAAFAAACGLEAPDAVIE